MHGGSFGAQAVLWHLAGLGWGASEGYGGTDGVGKVCIEGYVCLV